MLCTLYVYVGRSVCVGRGYVYVFILLISHLWNGPLAVVIKQKGRKRKWTEVKWPL